MREKKRFSFFLELIKWFHRYHFWFLLARQTINHCLLLCSPLFRNHIWTWKLMLLDKISKCIPYKKMCFLPSVLASALKTFYICSAKRPGGQGGEAECMDCWGGGATGGNVTNLLILSLMLMQFQHHISWQGYLFHISVPHFVMTVPPESKALFHSPLIPSPSWLQFASARLVPVTGRSFMLE